MSDFQFGLIVILCMVITAFVVLNSISKFVAAQIIKIQSVNKTKESSKMDSPVKSQAVKSDMKTKVITPFFDEIDYSEFDLPSLVRKQAH